MTIDQPSWLVVGLGNPGPQYERTRHNLGFMVIDKLAARLQTQVKREECRALIGRAFIGEAAAELVKPLTFMNLSGEAVSCLVKKPGRSKEALIVISDDLALPTGRLRIKAKGSHGGQNGLRSIIDRLGTNEFIRLRIGIAPEFTVTNASKFVLDNFSRDETPVIAEAVDAAADAVEMIIREGVGPAMARFNGES